MGNNENAAALAPQEFLTPTQLVARWGGAIGTGTLANWRAQGKGPKFTRLGVKIAYRVVDVEDYEKAQAVRADLAKTMAGQ